MPEGLRLQTDEGLLVADEALLAAGHLKEERPVDSQEPKISGSDAGACQ